MGHFHQTKPEAQKAAEKFVDDKRIRDIAIQFEPYGGWVVVLFPHYHDLSEFEGECEIKDGVRRQLTGQLSPKPQPVTKDDGTPLTSRVRTQGGYTPDSTWKTMDELHAAGKDREQITAALVAAGVDPKKASKETRHWMKARGLWKS